MLIKSHDNFINLSSKPVASPKMSPKDDGQLQNMRTSNVSSSSSVQLELVGAKVCQIIVPVLLCSLYVTILTRILEWNPLKLEPVAPIWSKMGAIRNPEAVAFAESIVNNIIIVSVFVILIIMMTLLMLFIFYMGWHACLNNYFYIPSLLIMALITPYVLCNVLTSLNVTLDYITLIIIMWNFTAFGMMSIFAIYEQAPLCAQQFYLIHNSAILAVLIISALPGWAPWLLLVFLVFWDLFAVLAPMGPLNLLIDMAEREGVVDMPGLLYNTDSTFKQPEDQEAITPIQEDGKLSKNLITSGNSNVNSGESKERKRRKSIEDKGVNMGLGDFIFYSILIGMTVKGRRSEDFYSTVAALNGVIVGLVLTLGILAATRRALPALPISIALGLMMAASTYYLVPGWYNLLATKQVFT